jgi:anti-anti-sigma factor
MTLAPFCHQATAPPATFLLPCELVRGSETQLVDVMLPRVRQESISLDLSGVERIDAAGIAALITLYCSASDAGHKFSVVSPNPHVLELLRLVGLEQILIENSEAERVNNRPAA